MATPPSSPVGSFTNGSPLANISSSVELGQLSAHRVTQVICEIETMISIAAFEPIKPALHTRSKSEGELKLKGLSELQIRDLVSLATTVAMKIQAHIPLLYNAIQGIEKTEDFRASRIIREACIKYV